MGLPASRPAQVAAVATAVTLVAASAATMVLPAAEPAPGVVAVRTAPAAGARSTPRARAAALEASAPAPASASPALLAAGTGPAPAGPTSAAAAVQDEPRAESERGPVAWLGSSTNPFDRAALGDRVYVQTITPASAPGPFGLSVFELLGRVLAALFHALLAPVELVDDAGFYRRLTEDAWGRPPRPEELEGFLRAPDRAGAIEAALASPELTRRWARDVLAPRLLAPRGSDLERQCETSLAQDQPLSGLLRELVLGDYGGGASGRAFEDVYPWAQQKSDRLLESFAGLPTKCARCHDAFDHGITDPQRDDPVWSRAQNHSLYAVFAERFWESDYGAGPVQPGFPVDGVPGKDKAALDRSLPPLPTTSAKQWRKKADYPQRAFLDENEQIFPYQDTRARREAFAQRFVASRAFLRGTGHWIFAEVVRPLLDPDRLTAKERAKLATPRMLDACEQVLREQGTSLRGFLRVLFGSIVWQTASTASAEHARLDPLLQLDRTFGRRTLRRCRAEAAWRALEQVAAAYPRRGSVDQEMFLGAFGAPLERTLLSERSDRVDGMQVLLLLNSGANQWDLSDLARQVGAGAGQLSLEEAQGRLFQRVLGRAPRAEEVQRLAALRARTTPPPEPQEWLEDLLTALGASHESILRH